MGEWETQAARAQTTSVSSSSEPSVKAELSPDTGSPRTTRPETWPVRADRHAGPRSLTQVVGTAVTAGHCHGCPSAHAGGRRRVFANMHLESGPCPAVVPGTRDVFTLRRT